MQSPIIGSTPDGKEPAYIQTGERRKGDPLTSECFTEIKKLLAGMPGNGLNKRLIAEQTKTSAVTVRLIDQSETFADYRALRSGKSNWHAQPKTVAPAKKPGLLRRLFGGR